MDRRFIAALGTYAGLAILAGFTLTGKIRLVTWIVLGYFALMTWIVVLRRGVD